MSEIYYLCANIFYRKGANRNSTPVFFIFYKHYITRNHLPILFRYDSSRTDIPSAVIAVV